jgi:acetyl esterase/lipase
VPVALYVHGGGWKSGDRSHGGFLDQMVAGLTARGVAVAAVDYRLVPTVVFPAPIEDVKCAVRFLRAKAADLHIDPAHIGAWGGSAGGHLVSLLATTDASDGYDTGEYADQSSRIQAVVDMFGLADASLQLPNGCMPHSALCNILGADATSTDLPDRIRAFSPVTYITADDPPFLILQGDHDHTVPQEQSQLLSKRLQAAGVDQQLVIVRGGNHGLGQTREVPPPDQLVQMTIDFLVKKLKG